MNSIYLLSSKAICIFSLKFLVHRSHPSKHFTQPSQGTFKAIPTISSLMTRSSRKLKPSKSKAPFCHSIESLPFCCYITSSPQQTFTSNLVHIFYLIINTFPNFPLNKLHQTPFIKKILYPKFPILPLHTSNNKSCLIVLFFFSLSSFMDHTRVSSCLILWAPIPYLSHVRILSLSPLYLIFVAPFNPWI